MSPGTGNGGEIFGALDDWQVGVYTGGHAALWNGAPGAPVDLHPAGYWHSEADAVWAGQQFGYVERTINDYPSAAMWSGTAGSYINMNPAGAWTSAISSAWGGQQGGSGWFGNGTYPSRAGLWTGTPASFVSIDPGVPYLQSYVRGMAQGEQVGAATAPSTFDHACLWHGTAATFVDLDPGWDYSRALGTCGGAQVGWTTLDWSNNTHAVIWFGTAASYHDLSQHLPAGYHNSVATSIATDGVRYFVGGYAERDNNNQTDAFLWMGDVATVCYANCDGSTATPVLNVGDFVCFLNRFAAADTAANCDHSTATPTLNVLDFVCFLNKFAVGCS